MNDYATDHAVIHSIEASEMDGRAARNGYHNGAMHWLLGLLVSFSLLSIPSLAQAIESPVDLLERESNKVLKILRDDRAKLDQDPDLIYRIVDEHVLPHLDDVTMAKLALGKNWKQATRDQKRTFVEEFRNLLVRTYSKSLIEFSDQKINYFPQDVPAGAKKASVKAEVIQPGGPSIPLAYSVRVKGDTWVVYDIQVDGVSLVTSYRGTFSQEVRKSGMEGLLEYMQDKNKDLSAKQSASKS